LDPGPCFFGAFRPWALVSLPHRTCPPPMALWLTAHAWHIIRHLMALRRRPHNQGTTPSDMHPIAPRTRPNSHHFTHLYRLVLTRSRWPQLADQNRFWAHFTPGSPRDPLLPINCAKFAGAGASPPPCAPPLRRCAAPWLGYAQPKTLKRGFRRIPSVDFMCVLGPLFFRSSLHWLVLTRHLAAPSCPKRDDFA
jgi:hypothetical protein